MKISVIIPAHNEEEYLPGGLEAVAEAAKISPYPVETIVVLNRCTDRTEEIAKASGAIIAIQKVINLGRLLNLSEGALRFLVKYQG